MTEIKAKYTHGGARPGAGAKVTTGLTTATVRVKKELVPLIKSINERYKLTGIIPELKE